MNSHTSPIDTSLPVNSSAPVLKPFFQVTQLSKTYGTVEALKDVTITIPKPEIIGLIGPNGAGKTTLIRSLLGLIRPSTGKTMFYGVDCWQQSLNTRRMIGFAHTSPKYPPGITLSEYLQWVSRLYDLPPELSKARITALLEYFDLQSAVDRSLSGFSSGMEGKTALIQAFLPAPKIIILDEPTANLDPVARLSLMKLVQELHTRYQTGFLISSHSLHELEQISTYYIFLEHGKVVWHGPASTLGDKSLAEFYLATIT